MTLPSALITCSVVEPDPRRLRVAVTGEVDLASGPVLEQFLVAELDRVPDGGELTVELSGITFLGAAGLRVLVAVARRAAGRSVAVRLHPVNEMVDRLLEIGRVWPQVLRGPRRVLHAVDPRPSAS